MNFQTKDFNGGASVSELHHLYRLRLLNIVLTS